MSYQVNVSDPALEDMRRTTEWIAQDSFDYAVAWEARVWEAIESLEEFPFRCPAAPEFFSFHPHARQHFSGRGRHVYRILFTVDGDTVNVLHVYHTARDVP